MVLKSTFTFCIVTLLLVVNFAAAETPRSQHRNHMHKMPIEELVQHFEEPDRLEWQKPDQVVDLLGDLKGKVVADIGAGSGYFTFRLAEKAKQVLAVDIDERFLKHLEKRKAKEAPNAPVEFIPATEDNPGLGDNSVDIVFLSNTYHHIENRVDYFKKLRSAFKPDGLLVVVDFYKDRDMPVGPPSWHKVSLETVLGELKEAGYSVQRVEQKLLPYQFIVFARQAASFANQELHQPASFTSFPGKS